VVAGAVQADAELAAEAADGGPAGADALGLEQVVGQLLVGPVGAVEALRGRPLDDPALEFVGQYGGDLAGLARGQARTQAVEPAFEVGVEPALDGARGDGQVLGDLLVGPVPGGQADDLDAIAELGVGFVAVGLIEPLRFLVWHANADHSLGLPSRSKWLGPRVLYASDNLTERVYQAGDPLGVGGSRQLHQAVNPARVEALRNKDWSPHREAQRRRSITLNLGANIPPGVHRGAAWSAEALALLGTDSDEAIAARIGKSRSAVRAERWRRKIPAKRS
jgi:hypothetical protein